MSERARRPYSTVFANPFVGQMVALSATDRARVSASLDNLERFPQLGHLYEGDLDTEIAVRELSVPHSSFVLYYWLDDPNQKIVCLYLWDTRRDPLVKFAGLYFD